ncbi:MAG TPA: class I SAM-dependent methyltransferase [Acetobacteraceae bacterium]|nr:class I SAM-dependent methyltransferase [Acetobacteraceae bacterium]
MSGTAGRVGGMFFMRPRDIGLFLRSARTDAAIAPLRARLGNQAAFDEIYAKGDPWASADPRYLYQQRKYDVIASLLPRRPYGRALDLGSGLGLLTRRLAAHADSVLGIDISAAAVRDATRAHADLTNVGFAQGDITNLPESLDGAFDLLVLADTLYYLPPPLNDTALKEAAQRMARLLRPGGLCLLANHYFSGADADSRLTRRIHQAFAWSPHFTLTAEYRRPFYIVSILERAD